MLSERQVSRVAEYKNTQKMAEYKNLTEYKARNYSPGMIYLFTPDSRFALSSGLNWISLHQLLVNIVRIREQNPGFVHVSLLLSKMHKSSETCIQVRGCSHLL